jgi:hypothetical protein
MFTGWLKRSNMGLGLSRGCSAPSFLGGFSDPPEEVVEEPLEQPNNTRVAKQVQKQRIMIPSAH